MLDISELHGPGVNLPSLHLSPGECIVVLGPSGAGKSLLLRAIADLDPCEGEILLHGRSWRSHEAPEWRRKVCLVPAESGWWSTAVRDHFNDSAHMEELAAALGIGEDCLKTPIDRLSTGERQRLALARALECEPEVLLLDEPTSALDEDSRSAVEAQLRRCLEQGRCIVMVTHDQSLAQHLGRRCLRVHDGQAVEEALP